MVVTELICQFNDGFSVCVASSWFELENSKVNFSLFLIADVTVSLQQVMQSVAEGDGNVEVCVELVGATLARSVAITLTPQPRTASKFNT